jgi:hypothetical protein
VAALQGLPPAARDKALRRNMAASAQLHPALARPDGHYRVRCCCHCRCVAVVLQLRAS